MLKATYLKFLSKKFYTRNTASQNGLCNNINSQTDATITNFIDNYNQLNMFRAIISPILRSSRLWHKAPSKLPAGSIDGALYHSLLLLRMDEIIARNMLS